MKNRSSLKNLPVSRPARKQFSNRVSKSKDTLDFSDVHGSLRKEFDLGNVCFIQFVGKIVFSFQALKNVNQSFMWVIN